jgi:hypothetical protein
MLIVSWEWFKSTTTVPLTCWRATSINR